MKENNPKPKCPRCNSFQIYTLINGKQRCKVCGWKTEDDLNNERRSTNADN